MITFGAIVGKASWSQCFVLVTLEMIFYSLNVTVTTKILKTVDLGGGMTIHTFGAFFGFVVAFFFNGRRAIRDDEKRAIGGYNSTTIAMIGTCFLFVYFPSFNAALTDGITQQRCVVNTLLSITSSALTASFITTIYVGKFDIEVLLHATLAGGVAMGSASNMIFSGYLSMIVGVVAGVLSSIGFLFVNKSQKKTIQLHDTCGVLFTHGFPGIVSGIASAFVTFTA